MEAEVLGGEDGWGVDFNLLEAVRFGWSKVENTEFKIFLLFYSVLPTSPFLSY